MTMITALDMQACVATEREVPVKPAK